MGLLFNGCYAAIKKSDGFFLVTGWVLQKQSVRGSWGAQCLLQTDSRERKKKRAKGTAKLKCDSGWTKPVNWWGTLQ